ncbi:uncharacterized protein Z520_12105 [Fonsecaea multimorphosa CBS 102226]|uniref:Uncharacterized protein n=1 Tax=Fonsecaea multimorphosa CBS 102226 TaxID=1442371 RepID=A0A0D2JP18_9EURO|nr:uncharacterized protein Z520_12105 [Fonsecaea multimorphosa CBS 102226]KIX92224.1 hypothetical protein Z520_12105 [Fonsecaea multimorphosa CBS 102226]
MSRPNTPRQRANTFSLDDAIDSLAPISMLRCPRTHVDQAGRVEIGRPLSNPGIQRPLDIVGSRTKGNPKGLDTGAPKASNSDKNNEADPMDKERPFRKQDDFIPL